MDISAADDGTARFERVEAGTPALGPNDIHIWRLSTDADTASTALVDARRLLSEDEHRRAERFATDRLRTAFILAHGALRLVLARYTCQPAEMLAFERHAFGKPVLRQAGPQRDARLHFNLSHSGELALVALSAACAVGVDVEQVRTIPDADAIAARFFSSTECQAYRAMPAADRPSAFFRCWTRKEAFIKALGEGLSRPLGSFDVALDRDTSAALVRVDADAGEAARWFLQGFTPAAGYAAAVAARHRPVTLSYLELA